MELNNAILLETKDNYLKIVTDFSMTLIQQTTLDEVIWELAKNVSHTLGFYDCVIYLFDSNKNELIQKAAFGPKNPYPFHISEPIVLPLGVGIVGSVAESRVAEIVNDTSRDSRYIIDDETRLSEIAVPIVFEDKLIGIIDSEHPSKNFFSKEQLDILQIIASMSATKIVQAKVFDDLQIQTERLKVTNERLLQFAYIASHDLRSPVSNIISLLSFLDTTKIEGENSFFIEKIKQASEKLQGNLQLLVDLVTDEKSLYKNRDKIIFSNLLQEVTLSIGKQIEENEASIISNFEVESINYPSVYLHSILLNLVNNAIKYKAPNRVPVIEVSTAPKGKYTCLSVKDNGKGIDLERNGHKIFSRLERFDKDVEGKGLGLYLIKNHVQAFGGRIDVESELGKGTIFNVLLSNSWKI